MPQRHTPKETGLLARNAEQINRNERAIAKAQSRDGVSAWIPAVLQNSFAAPSAPYGKVAYRLNGDDLQFKGHVDATGATSGTVAFTLLPPFWPDTDISFLTDIYNGAAFSVARCFISSVNGQVTLTWPAV